MTQVAVAVADGDGAAVVAVGHIAVGAADLAATLAELAGQSIEPEREPYRVREGGSLICVVRDPDGYRIELIDKSGA